MKTLPLGRPGRIFNGGGKTNNFSFAAASGYWKVPRPSGNFHVSILIMKYDNRQTNKKQKTRIQSTINDGVFETPTVMEIQTVFKGPFNLCTIGMPSFLTIRFAH